jgi:hypothetical protein
MKSIEEVRELFDNNLKDHLKDLETQRKNISKNFLLMALALALGIISVVLFHENVRGVILPIFAILSIIYLAVKTSKIYSAYRDIFKQKIVRKLINSIDENWEYDYQSYLDPNDYQRSNLFKIRYDRYSGDDLIQGQIDKTDFVFSELHTEYKTTTTDSKGNTKTQWHTIFKGIIGHADFNKEIKGNTYVLPDTAEKLFGKWGQKLQSDSRGDLVKLENPDFEREFAVFSTDQIEARYILTPSIMEALVEFKHIINNNVYLSFIGSRMYFAISISANLFEPRVFKSGLNFEDINSMYNHLNIINLIVTQMNLNTRIWTKN